jgi:hypothetical protein
LSGEVLISISARSRFHQWLVSGWSGFIGSLRPKRLTSEIRSDSQPISQPAHSPATDRKFARKAGRTSFQKICSSSFTVYLLGAQTCAA